MRFFFVKLYNIKFRSHQTHYNFERGQVSIWDCQIDVTLKQILCEFYSSLGDKWLDLSISELEIELGIEIWG